MDGNQSTPTPERQAASSPELSIEQSASKLESKAAPVAAEAAQSGPKADDGAAVAQAQVAAVIADGPVQAQASQPAADATLPATAADVDVIEPEWVKRAEEAVAANRDDPRAEEAAVEALQVEYLKKRYNLEVKPSEEQP
jgi:hypothetical protein